MQSCVAGRMGDVVLRWLHAEPVDFATSDWSKSNLVPRAREDPAKTDKYPETMEADMQITSHHRDRLFRSSPLASSGMFFEARL